MELGRASTSTKLVLRKTVDKWSEKLRDLPAGTHVVVLEQMAFEDGCVRAKVGIDSSPRGVAVHALGWVTSLKDGEAKLCSTQQTDLDGGASGIHGEANLQGLPIPSDGNALRNAPNDSMASRIAARRRKAARSRTARAASIREGPAEPTPSTQGEPTSGPSKAKSSRPYLPWSALVSASEEYRKKANVTNGQDLESLASRLGKMLCTKRTKIDHLVSEWDRNGDGNISKSEFRIHIRKLGLDADGSASDELYDAMDDDGSGALTLLKIKAALQKLQDAADSAQKQSAFVGSRRDGYARIASAFEAAAEETAKVDVAEKELASLRNNRSVASRLGSLLSLRNIKIGDVMSSWDKDGNGLIDQEEFRTHITKLGFNALNDEIDSVFQELDDDGSGELDFDETKVALKKLQWDAASTVKAEKDKVAEVAQAKKAAKASQKLAHGVADEILAALDAADQALREETEAKAAAELAKKVAKEAKLREEKQLAAERMNASKLAFFSAPEQPSALGAQVATSTVRPVQPKQRP